MDFSQMSYASVVIDSIADDAGPLVLRLLADPATYGRISFITRMGMPAGNDVAMIKFDDDPLIGVTGDVYEVK